MNQGENDQQVQGSAGGEGEASCIYFGRALDEMEVGGQSHAGTRPVPPRRVCARPARSNERNTSREGT